MSGTKSYYLLETSGERRQIWGPYSTLGHARREAGVRHAVVSGPKCGNGITLTRGEVNAAVNAGTIIPEDGTDRNVLAGN